MARRITISDRLYDRLIDIVNSELQSAGEHTTDMRMNGTDDDLNNALDAEQDVQNVMDAITDAECIPDGEETPEDERKPLGNEYGIKYLITEGLNTILKRIDTENELPRCNIQCHYMVGGRCLVSKFEPSEEPMECMNQLTDRIIEEVQDND